MPHVVISYSRKDSNLVELVQSDLAEYHHDVAPPWRDQDDIPGGTDWAAVIDAAIDESYAVIVVCSNNSAASDWVEKEVLRARKSDRPIVPLQLDAGSVPLNLRHFQSVDFSGVTHSQGLAQIRHYRLAFEKLVKAVDEAQPLIRFERELGSADPIKRLAAARGLGCAGETSAIAPLLGALKDDDGDVRYEAALSLGRIGDASASRSLVRASEDEDSDVVAAAAWALGEIGALDAITPLIDLLDHTDRIVRERVAVALGRIHSQADGDVSAVVRPLIGVLRTDPMSTVRDAAESALRSVGGEEAERALARLSAFEPEAQELAEEA